MIKIKHIVCDDKNKTYCMFFNLWITKTDRQTKYFYHTCEIIYKIIRSIKKLDIKNRFNNSFIGIKQLYTVKNVKMYTRQHIS